MTAACLPTALPPLRTPEKPTDTLLSTAPSPSMSSTTTDNALSLSETRQSPASLPPALPTGLPPARTSMSTHATKSPPKWEILTSFAATKP